MPNSGSFALCGRDRLVTHPHCGPPVHGQKLNKHVIKCHQAEQVLY